MEYQKEFRIAEPKGEEKSRVLGGWQTVSARESMIKLFNQMKSRGHFKHYDSYQSWEKAKYQSQNTEK